MHAKIIYPELSYKIVGLAIDVRKELGFGFLEKVYENALMVALRENGIFAEQQRPIKVFPMVTKWAIITPTSSSKKL